MFMTMYQKSLQVILFCRCFCFDYVYDYVPEVTAGHSAWSSFAIQSFDFVLAYHMPCVKGGRAGISLERGERETIRTRREDNQK